MLVVCVLCFALSPFDPCSFAAGVLDFGVVSHCRSISVPLFIIVVIIPEPCKELRSRPQLLMVGIVPCQPSSTRVLIVAHIQC